MPKQLRWIPFTTLMLIILSMPAWASTAPEGRSLTKLDTKLCPIGLIDFDDGDSFVCDKEQIRVLGIDAPEIIHEEHGILEDQPEGKRAASATQSILKGAKRILIVRKGKDRYGRTKAHVIVDGELLAVKLIKRGLAYESVRHYGDEGMPEFALQIIEASRSYPKPRFEEPWSWRKAHQQKKPVVEKK